MATIAQIREGLASNLSAIADVQVSAYMLASPTPPAIHIIPPAIEYHQAMQNGLGTVSVTVQLLAALGPDIGAQKKLDLYRAPSGASSVKAAIEADPTLGGVVKDCIVVSASEPQVLVLQGERQLLVCDFEVEVYD